MTSSITLLSSSSSYIRLFKSWQTQLVLANNHRFMAIIRWPAPPVNNWRILLLISFTAHMPLLTATSAFGLGRRRWSSRQCYLHRLRTCMTVLTITSGVLGGIRRIPTSGFFWQRILTSVIINKRGTFRPFATPVCIYPPPSWRRQHIRKQLQGIRESPFDWMTMLAW